MGVVRKVCEVNMIDIYVQDIRRALENKCYFSALALALALPDICGAVEFSYDTPVAKRYIGWYDRYVYPFVGDQNDTPNLTGELVYNLRNTFLHQGWPNINSSKIKTEREQVDRFILVLGDGTVISQWSFRYSMNLTAADPDAGSVDFRGFLIDISYLCGLIGQIATEYYANNEEKFSFNFRAYTQDYLFSKDPSFIDKKNDAMEQDPIGTILMAKANEKLKRTGYKLEDNITKRTLGSMKKYLPLALELPMISTIGYYNAHANEYAELTVKADMTEQYAKFMAYLPAGAGILDAGCGSGRDSLFFMKKGYSVTMLDASAGMCKCAEALTGQKALHMKFDKIDFEKQFDGIWACASLLHVPENELETVFAKFWRALKDNGVLYASWKYGEDERDDGERFYCDMTEEKLKNFLARVGLFDCLDCWVAEDALPLGREQKWLNVVLRKM